MVRVSLGASFVGELRMAIQAQAVRIILELERSVIRRPAMVVGVVTASATGIAFAKALRALERLYDECGLAEATIFEEAFARKLGKGHGGITQEESATARIVQFTVWTCRVDI